MNIFEVYGDYRTMNNEELVYILTNSEHMVYKVREREAVYGETPDLDNILNRMTPARKKLALAAIELYKRLRLGRAESNQLNSSEKVYREMQPVLDDISNEECWAIFLNQSSRIIRKLRISSGGYTSTAVDIRLVIREALLSKVTSFILCHNHPSGNQKPSNEDDRLTRQIKEEAALMDIQLLDHLIVTKKSYYSYADEGRI